MDTVPHIDLQGFDVSGCGQVRRPGEAGDSDFQNAEFWSCEEQAKLRA